MKGQNTFIFNTLSLPSQNGKQRKYLITHCFISHREGLAYLPDGRVLLEHPVVVVDQGHVLLLELLGSHLWGEKRKKRIKIHLLILGFPILHNFSFSGEGKKERKNLHI